MELSRRLTLGLIGAGLLTRPALAATPVGIAVSVTGDVALERAGGALPLAAETELQLLDYVLTRPDGLALLRLYDDMQVNLGGDSRFTVDEFVASQSGTLTLGGAMVFDRPEGLPPVDITVQTAFGQIGVRGTRFFVGPSREKYAVFVDHGAVSLTAGGVERMLKAGDGVDLDTVGNPPSEVVQWGEARIVEAFASVGLTR
jgi:ferric-dicitrate binding protein FerR (iron transport regulator)